MLSSQFSVATPNHSELKTKNSTLGPLTALYIWGRASLMLLEIVHSYYMCRSVSPCPTCTRRNLRILGMCAQGASLMLRKIYVVPTIVEVFAVVRNMRKRIGAVSMQASGLRVLSCSVNSRLSTQNSGLGPTRRPAAPYVAKNLRSADNCRGVRRDGKTAQNDTSGITLNRDCPYLALWRKKRQTRTNEHSPDGFGSSGFRIGATIPRG